MKPSARLFFVAVTVSFGAYFPRGYFAIVYTVSQNVFEQWINASFMSNSTSNTYHKSEIIWSAITAGTYIAKILGIAIAVFVSDRWGRVPCNLLGYPILISSIWLQYLARSTGSFQLLVGGILLNGVQNGMTLVVTSVFLAEIGYASQIRGSLSSLSGIAGALGELMGALLGLEEIFGTSPYWHYLLLCPIPIIGLGIAGTFYAKETPTYLCWKERPFEEIEKSITFYFTDVTDQDILQAIKENSSGKVQETASTCVFMRSRSHRRALWLSFLLRTLLGIGGVGFMYSFATKIMNTFIPGTITRWGKWSTFAFCFISIGVSSGAMWLVEKWGRKPLTLWGFAIMLSMHFTLCLLWLLSHTGLPVIGYGAIGAMGLWWLGYNWTNISTSALLVEMFNQSGRSKGKAIAAVYSLILNGALSLVFVPLFASALGGYVFGCLGVLMAPFLAIAWLHIPETKKLSLFTGINTKHHKILPSQVNLMAVKL